MTDRNISRHVRERLGLTQAELARLLNRDSDRGVRAWEAEPGSPMHRNPSPEALILLDALLHVPALRRYLGLPTRLEE